MASFDWYMGPAQKFQYENDFSTTSTNKYSVSLKDLDPLFNTCRLSEQEFIQIWHLIDIRGDNELDKIQFVHFCHCVNSRRRGSTIPTGLPLQIKEQFLARAESPTHDIYIRPDYNSPDKDKTEGELKSELKKLENELRVAMEDNDAAKLHLKALKALATQK